MKKQLKEIKIHIYKSSRKKSVSNSLGFLGKGLDDKTPSGKTRRSKHTYLEIY